MKKNLVIVESPTKAKTISRFLGSDYDVQASFGHIRDLPKSKMGIDIEHNFEPTYTIPLKAKPVVAELKAKAAKAARVILATDEDREGEAIAWHLASALDLNKNADKHPIERIVFHEITKSAIDEALLHPRGLDMNLIDAQQARRILDRLVGYELSPFLWKKIRYGLSAGRVQSVALRLIVEREREIQKFKSEEYWSVEPKFEKDKITFSAKLNKIDAKSVGKMDISGKEAADKILADVTDAKFTVAAVTKKQQKRSPSPAFITSTLQQEAARKLGMSAKQTMVIAQQLYEGIAIGAEGNTGLITYMRTDSVNLAKQALEQAGNVISQRFGKEYYEGPRSYNTKSKNAQEAHEAIRPTDLSRTPDTIKEYLDRGQQRLYELIWKRTIASQMADAQVEATAADILAPGKSGSVYNFRANGQRIVFEGFIKAYTEGRDEEGDDSDSEGLLPELKEGENLKPLEIKGLQHFTEPPARFSDATLIKTLEANGIGRPSTYAPTLSTIQDRGYVEKEDKKYKPTEVGFLVTDLLVEHFPKIVDLQFTAKMEDDLDQVAEGKEKWQPVIKEFYGPFKENVDKKQAEVEKQIEVSEVPCPHCGKPMIIKFGRYGRFLACPEGEKITKPLPEEEAQIKALEEKTKGEMCPICGGPMKIQRGRFGFFLGCMKYPECKGIKKILTKIGFKCPKCEIGDVVERKSRGRGKPFYSCSRYPDCDFIINKKPESEEELKELWAAEQAKPKREKKLSEKKLIGAKPRGGAKAKTPTKAKAANKDKS